MPRRFVAVSLALASALALAAASSIRVRAHTSENAVLRVAFSARPQRVERCRTLSAEELAELPQHMRQSVECEGFTARYRLEVLRDDVRLATAELRGGGLRHDRQLYVLRDLAIPSGRSTVEVRLSRIDSTGRTAKAHEDSSDSRDDRGPREKEHDSEDEARSGAPDRQDREADERRRRIGGEIPALLVLRETTTLTPREVMLVTYDQGERRLRVVRRPR